MPQNCPYLTDGTVTVEKLACEESPNRKKENHKLSMTWERKKAGEPVDFVSMPPIRDSRFVHDWSDR